MSEKQHMIEDSKRFILKNIQNMDVIKSAANQIQMSYESFRKAMLEAGCGDVLPEQHVPEVPVEFIQPTLCRVSASSTKRAIHSTHSSASYSRSSFRSTIRLFA